jgi:uncharacterized protein with HEPN domain
MPPEDTIRLRHMLEAAESAVRLCEGFDAAQFESDERTWRAVLNCVQVLGEAANHLSEATKQEIAELPWRDIIRMRHRLVHVYFDVNLELLWIVVERDLPPLIETLRRRFA